jgi:hypothetical protein
VTIPFGCVVPVVSSTDEAVGTVPRGAARDDPGGLGVGPECLVAYHDADGDEHG